jgi:hypothetical protein
MKWRCLLCQATVGLLLSACPPAQPSQQALAARSCDDFCNDANCIAMKTSLCSLKYAAPNECEMGVKAWCQQEHVDCWLKCSKPVMCPSCP